MAEGPGPSGTQRRASETEATETADFRRNMRQQYRDLTQIVQGVLVCFIMETGLAYIDDSVACFIMLWMPLCLENRTSLVSPGNEGLSGKMDFLNSQVAHSTYLGWLCWVIDTLPYGCV